MKSVMVSMPGGTGRVSGVPPVPYHSPTDTPSRLLTHKALLLAVPQWGSPHAVGDQRKESLLHLRPETGGTSREGQHTPAGSRPSIPTYNTFTRWVNSPETVPQPQTCLLVPVKPPHSSLVPVLWPPAPILPPWPRPTCREVSKTTSLELVGIRS